MARRFIEFRVAFVTLLKLGFLVVEYRLMIHEGLSHVVLGTDLYLTLTPDRVCLGGLVLALMVYKVVDQTSVEYPIWWMKRVIKGVLNLSGAVGTSFGYGPLRDLKHRVITAWIQRVNVHMDRD